MLLQIAVLIAIAVIARSTGSGWLFAIGWVAASGVLARQWQLIRTRQGAPCFDAFLLNNHMGALLFAGFFLDYLVRNIN